MALSIRLSNVMKMISILTTFYPFVSAGSSDLIEYVERVHCRMREACSGVYGSDGRLQNNLAQRNDEIGAKYRAAKERVDREIEHMKKKIEERRILVKEAIKEFEEKNKGVNDGSRKKLLIDFVEERLKGKNLDSASMGKELNVVYGESIGSAKDGFNRFVRAYRKSQVLAVTELYRKNGSIGNESGGSFISRSLGKSNLMQDYKSLVTDRERYQYRDYDDNLLKPLDKTGTVKTMTDVGVEIQRDANSDSRARIGSMREAAAREQELQAEKRVQEIKAAQAGRSGLGAGKAAGIAGALLGVGMTGAQAAVLYRDLDDCKNKFALSREEILVLKEISATDSGPFDSGNCQKVTIDPDLLGSVYGENLVGPGMEKMIAAKVNALREQQSFDLQFSESTTPCNSGLKIRDGQTEIFNMKKAKEGGRFIGEGGTGSIRYSVEVSYVDGELAPDFPTIKCLDENLTEDGPCTSILTEILRHSQKNWSSGLIRPQRPFQSLFKAIKDDSNLANSFCKSNEKEKKIICSLGQNYEKIQIALSGLSIVCPGNLNGSSDATKSLNRSQK